MRLPRLAEFLGQPLRRYLEHLDAYLSGSKIEPGPGVEAEQTSRGLVLTFGGFGLALIKTTSAVTGRSGTTPGTGTADILTWDGTAIGTAGTITLRNLAAGAWSTGKHGFAVKFSGAWWLVSLEC